MRGKPVPPATFDLPREHQRAFSKGERTGGDRPRPLSRKRLRSKHPSPVFTMSEA